MKNLLSILKMDFAKINQTGKNLCLFSCLLCCLILVFGSSFQSLAAISSSSNAFAVNPDYLIGSASNADPYGIATMELTDEDYYIQPFSSVGTVVNTIDNSSVIISITNGEFTNYFHVPCDLSNNRFSFSWSVPDMFSGYYIESIQFYIVNSDLKLNSLPRPSGNYLYSFDFSSDFSFDLQGDPYLQSVYVYLNSISDTVNTLLPYSFNSGDFYVNPFALKFGSSYSVLRHVINVDFDSRLEDIGGSFAIRFAPTDTEGAPLAGSDISSSTAFENDLSSSLSDISSSIGDMSSSMDSAAENLEYISTSQNLIILGIDNVIMHISDQLYAFWDQLYNLIHEPTYARLGDILDAIRNLDLEITVEMKEVTDAVNKMNQDMQNKLQNVQQTLTGGYDNSGINQDQAALDSSLQEYEQVEQNVLDNVNDSLNSFEFDSGMDEYKTSIQVFSDFLQALYESAGAFKIVINLSLMLSVAGIVIGLYRFKDGG